MKVQELMTRDVVSTQARTSLSRAARLMWDHDCGFLPVVNPEGHITSVITDRDICRAVTTSARPASRIAVDETSSKTVYSVTPDDDVAVALETMKTHQVRRLPVVSREGHIKGILSMNDIVLRAGGAGVKNDDIVETLKSICRHTQVEMV